MNRCPEHADKTPFSSRPKAVLAIETIKRNSEHGSRRPERAYQCDTCKRWFLTSLAK